MNFDFGLYDAGIVAVVLTLVGVLKAYVQDRFVPLLPLILGFLGGALGYFTGQIESTVDGSVAAQILWYGFLYATIASTLFKTYKTSIRGQ